MLSSRQALLAAVDAAKPGGGWKTQQMALSHEQDPRRAIRNPRNCSWGPRNIYGCESMSLWSILTTILTVSDLTFLGPGIARRQDQSDCAYMHAETAMKTATNEVRAIMCFK